MQHLITILWRRRTVCAAIAMLLVVLPAQQIFASPPVITLTAPPADDSVATPWINMGLSIDADVFPVTVEVYGDETANPGTLIFAKTGISMDTSISLTWSAPRFEPEAIYTLALLHFDENSGATTADASGNGHTGTLTGTTPPVWTDEGRFGYGLDFDGAEDYVKLPDLDNSLDVDPVSGALTMEAWIYPHSIGGNTYRAFLSKRDSAVATDVNYSVYLNNSNGAISFYNGTFPAGFYISSVIPPVNQWSYVALTLDAADSILRFYMNGELEDSVLSATFGPVHDGPLTIGTSQTPTGNRSFDGVIDEVRLTSRVLSSDEIAANYILDRGTYSWKVTADDATPETGTSEIREFTIGLVLDPIGDQSVAEGGHLVVDIAAANPDDEPIDFTHSALSANMSFSNLGNGQATLTFDPDYDQAGTYPITLTAFDGIETVSRNFSITVTNTNRPPVVSDIPDQTVPEGGAFAAIDLSLFVDDPDVPIDDHIDWTYSGNSQLSVSIVGDLATVTIPHGDWYGEETITFTATDLWAASDADEAVLTVYPTNDPPVVDPVDDLEVHEGNTAGFVVSAVDIDGTIPSLSASLSPSGDLPPGALFEDNLDGTGTFSWTPDGDQSGIYDIRFTAEDDSEATGYTDMTITVNDDATPPQLQLVSPANGSITSGPGQELAAQLSDVSAMKVWTYAGKHPDSMTVLQIDHDVMGPDLSVMWDAPLLPSNAPSTMALWHFENGAEYTVLDYSGHGNTGTFQGQISGGSIWSESGRFGYAAILNGQDNYVICDPSPSFDIDSATGGLTIETWAYPHDILGNQWQGLLAKRGWLQPDGPCNYQMSLDNGHLAFYSKGDDSRWEKYLISDLVVPENEWSFLAVTLDAHEGIVRFYRNGVLGDEISGACFGPAASTNLVLGSTYRPLECFDGLLDETRLTNRALSDAEIVMDYLHIGGGDHYWKVVAEDAVGNQATSPTWHFDISDANDPRITQMEPPNGAMAVYPHMELHVTAWDESPLTVFIYGDATTSAADLLFVGEYGMAADIHCDWTAAVFEPDPPYTTGLWHFDENTGTAAYDESFKGNNASFAGSPTWTTDGRFGYALDFDGVSDYLTVPDLNNGLDVDPATGALTVEAWIKPDTVGGNIYRSFVSKRSSTEATDVNYAVYLNSTNGAVSFYNGVFPSGFYISSDIPPTREWSYIAVTLDAAEGLLRFYRDGVIRDSIAGATFGSINDADLTIGASRTPTGNRYFDGRIDEVRLTDRVLTDQEIAANFALTRSTYYWRAVVEDAEGNSVETETRYFTTNLFTCGDANGDARINIGDAVYLINYIFKGGPAPDPLEAGDANCDYAVNIGDPVYLINYIFKGGPEPCCP
jgi:hypothetical protein